MARESDAPKVPLTPQRPNEQHRRPLPQHPEFGKPSPLRPANTQANHLFNIPKSNQTRPEHHRPAARPNPQTASQPSTATQAYRPQPTSNAASTPASSFKRRDPYNPFKPVQPSAYKSLRDDDVVEIARPENTLWTTPRAPRTLYSSKPAPIPMASSTKNLNAFIQMTSTEPSFSTSSRQPNQRFGSFDANTYVDTEKANENIKALLEGAFDEEDESQEVKPKRKRGKRSKKNKKGKKKSPEKTTPEVDDLDDLAAQLQGFTVKDETATDAKETDDQAEKNAPEEEETEAPEVNNASGDDGSEDDSADEEDDDGTVEGLSVKLLPHQIAGVKWMREKERGQTKSKGIAPKGGILADDMGLGKTVQAIALLLTNPKPTEENDDDDGENDEKPELPAGLSKTTLVVAPLALIKQWEAEIASKVEHSHRLRVCVYHGASRAKSNDDLDEYDVVITTYGTLTSEHGASGKGNKKSALFPVHWYRIILDEAHTIKNRNAKATQAACALDAEYRWCLSGTPMQNNLDELQSLIKFLRIKPYNDLAAWREQITKPLANGLGGLAIERLQVYLKAFMKRRTKDVLKLNEKSKPGEEGAEGETKKSSNGFQIVKREVINVDAEFTPAEMNFYKRLEQRTENRLEKMMGGSKLDYAGALVLLLRLRQACNHPDLVKSDLANDKDVLLQNGLTGSQPTASKKDDLDSVADLFGALSVVSKKCDVCQAELSPEEGKAGTSRCGECEADLADSFIGHEKKDKKKKMKKKKTKHTDGNASPSGRTSEARVARARQNRRVVLDSDDEDDAEWIVPEDQRSVPNLGQAGGTDDEDAEGGGDWLGSEDSETDEDEDESQSLDTDDDVNEEEDIYLDGENGTQLLASTKIKHLMTVLKREAFDYKFIVFSVFTSMLDKIEPFLKKAGIGYARYDGSMRNDHREASLDKLRNHGATRVLLCSLRAGALGLNLTAASRVVILEPFWNPFVEEQAIDRVHRLNQTVDVKIYKMIIKETVEERIVDLQNRKRELANMTIEGKTAAAKLTMRDMMALFGRDAESRYTAKQEDLDLTSKASKATTRLLGSATDNHGTPMKSGSQSSSSRERSRPEHGHRPPPRAEDSVYGRRW
ncbi:hypothetical protein ASPZODRAFT_135394 [Penicilliopsis zonata CBS 506.65]|uniref:Helicase ATP-binding domain-containing protein n=1 Tax=Penicilliopsis zonata CBS 506.65 TaxID=1073090 RepID=A0A1L9S9Y7_9EURO|nr:hypothetical protein ASPZODRAFT_135394 [Penicilliopsis zonata CBS 506.65]OJJ43974.1 hypothetical protein ASPZODRAFT_135394 [Penicilliopsis zonata CBS 506.65]